MATILVVDDVAANREFIVTLLRYQGHRLVEAVDGRGGLAAAQAEHPDLVITDVLMPVMDGYEFVRQLRLDPTTSGIPVVFYTAHYGEREARALALSSGVSWVLTKPAEPEEVLRIVGGVLSRTSDTGMLPSTSPLRRGFDREHLRLVTNKLSERAGELTTANARLRALINISLELASEPDSVRLLQHVCVAARDLFGATYVTLGILDRDDRTLQRLVTDGTDAASWIKTGDAAPGILGAVVAERQTTRGDNAGGDPAKLQLPSLHPAVHAFLAAPIASPAHVYGWILLVGNEGRTFSEDDEQLVKALSGQVGRIYANGYLTTVARHERDRAQRYLDTAEVILLALDVEGRITLVNRYACSVLGWTAEELLGHDWVETCLPARTRDALKKRFHNLIAGDLSIVENPILTRSGEERLIEWRNTVLRDDAGLVIGTLSSGTDITERNQAVEALRTAEERMRFALEAADVGIWDMDYTTGLLEWSETLEAQYGLQPGTFGGSFEAFVERIHPGDRESALETVGKAMKSGADFSVLNRAIHPDGTVRWLSGAGRVLLGERGEPLRGVGISQDVTERKHAEAELKHLNDEIQLQRLQVFKATMRTVQDIVNNLLNGLQLAHLEAEGQQPAEMHTLVDQVIQEAAVKLKMLRDLETVKEKASPG